jgi:L-ascorbate metabolism protein UlaG (beta-lactamase superfamily)
MRMMLIGGPTLLIEWHGLRLLTDPTFDPAGGSYPIGPITLRKTRGPAIGVDALGPVDAVLLSHDQHDDNLDTTGRAFLPRAGKVFTTTSGAARLGGNAIGLAPWTSADLRTPEGGRLIVEATPARHGPEGCEPICGDVTGFLLQPDTGTTDDAIYFSGDTVWYEGVAEVAHRSRVTVAVLCLGGARLPEVGPDPLTMTADDAIATARAFSDATIIPVHYDGWAHWPEGREQLSAAFAAAGLTDRIQWLTPGEWATVR